MSDVIYLSNVRLSFPHIAEPQRAVIESTGKERISYNCELIMPKDHPGFVQFMQQYGKLAVDKWKEHANDVMKMVQSDRKIRCYGDGAEKINKKTFKPYDGYDGNVFITAGRDHQPQIIQADGKAVDPTNTMACLQLAKRLYGGCRVNAAIKPWLQNNQYGRGVRCDLVAIQFAGDDTPFGEGLVDATPLFGAVAVQSQPQMPSAPFAAQSGLPSFLGGQ